MADLKKTLIIGATTNTERYAYLATEMLTEYHHPIVLVGIREGNVLGNEILVGKPEIKEVDTVTLYVGVKNQPEWYDYILSLKPKRVIFNPGTENPELISLVEKNDIEAVMGCTLVMLRSKQF
jgi:uncharacterized protein